MDTPYFFMYKILFKEYKNYSLAIFVFILISENENLQYI